MLWLASLASAGQPLPLLLEPRDEQIVLELVAMELALDGVPSGVVSMMSSHGFHGPVVRLVTGPLGEPPLVRSLRSYRYHADGTLISREDERELTLPRELFPLPPLPDAPCTLAHAARLAMPWSEGEHQDRLAIAAPRDDGFAVYLLHTIGLREGPANVTVLRFDARCEVTSLHVEPTSIPVPGARYAVHERALEALPRPRLAGWTFEGRAGELVREICSWSGREPPVVRDRRVTLVMEPGTPALALKLVPAILEAAAPATGPRQLEDGQQVFVEVEASRRRISLVWSAP